MTQLIVYLALILGGLVLGSFAGATVWRLRARQLAADKKAGDKVDNREYKQLQPLATSSLAADRSRCLSCQTTLKWYDLVPLVSWLSLKGRCRYCHKPIGWLEPLIELGVAGLFVVSYLFWPFALDSGLQIAAFVVWLLAGVVLAILFAYDSKWFLLPDKLNLALIGIGLISVGLQVAITSDPAGTLASAVGAVGIMSGIYLVLHLVSSGRWIGLGDVKLGIGLGLLLGQWQLAIIALFAANLLGTLIVLPLLLSKKLDRRSKVPFGPLLIAGTVIALLWGQQLVDLYLANILF